MATILSRKPGGSGGGGGAPSGPAGGSLSGSYPNPGIANDSVGADEIDGADAAAIRSLLGVSYTLIQEITVPSGGSASVDFTSIPATYRHLEFYIVAFTENAADQNLLVRFNNDSSAIYHYQYASVANNTFAGSSADTQTSTLAGVLSATGRADPMISKVVIPYYAGTAFTKELMADWNDPFVGRGWIGGRWSSLAAINRVSFISGGSSDVKQGSVFSLFGIS